jgi:hypothetical protein
LPPNFEGLTAVADGVLIKKTGCLIKGKEVCLIEN